MLGLLCAVLAVPLTAVRCGKLLLQGPAPRRLRRAGLGSGLRMVYRTCFARAMRRLLKHGVDRVPGFRAPRVVLEGRPESLEGPCIVVFLHSPWDQVLVRELRARRFCLVLADEVWASPLGRFYAGTGPARLRRTLEALRGGGRVAVVLDDFESRRFQPHRFLGLPVRIATGVPRLAAAAGVPVVPLAAHYRGGRVRVRAGPRSPVGRSPQAQGRAVDDLLRFFEREVRRAPDSWGRLLPFLRRASARG